MFSTLRAVARDPEGKVLLLGALLLIVVGTIVYMLLEHWSPVDALYFSVVTLATVGYGDLHPTTAVSKLFTVVYILMGVGIIAAFASELAKYRKPPERLARRLGVHAEDLAEAEEQAPPTNRGA